MDVRIYGRNVALTDRFKTYATGKLDKVAALVDRAQALELKVSHENPNRGASSDAKVELTLIGPGPVIRAESGAADKFAAFDLAYDKLLERIRRAKDRKRISRRGRRAPKSLGEVSQTGFADVAVRPASPEALGTAPIAVIDASQPSEDVEQEYSPVVIRRKEFSSPRITLDDALSNMELVGHDFYLFVDAETGRPSVVYRRKGWDYGVISLTVEE